MIHDLFPSIEAELQRQIARLDRPATAGFHQMLTYHMGWSGERAGPEATGKRIRPLLLCLVFLACEPPLGLQAALPAAAAIEIIHNFSLVHDDIQDNSPTRRGRPTLWNKWGTPMAINAGDALFSIAHQAIMGLEGFHPAARVLTAARILQDACLDLTRGQYLDMSFEGQSDPDEEKYWIMISGKTAALLSAACAIGSLLGLAGEKAQSSYTSFGHELGLAFQVQDDLLGIWGDEALTGKSSASDLLEGKNSLPILYGLKQGGRFAGRWKQGPIQAGEVRELAALLKTEGAYDYAQSRAVQYTSQALDNLEQAAPKGQAGQALAQLTEKLLQRSS